MTIYGVADNRVDYHAIDDATRRGLCDSIGMLVHETALVHDNRAWTVRTTTLSSDLQKRLTPKKTPAYPVGPNVIFANQDTVDSLDSSSTAFLIAPDLIATAGHSAWDEMKKGKRDISEYYFVIGWRITAAGGQPTNPIPETQVYQCKDVMLVTKPGRLGGPGQPDVAIIRLRTNATQAPLTFAPGTPAEGATLWMAGHGDTLPLKYGMGVCSRRDKRQNPNPPNIQTFYHNLTSFHGDSGSPIFNNNNQVVGVMVWGPSDYDASTGTIVAELSAQVPASLDEWSVAQVTEHMRWLIDYANAKVTALVWVTKSSTKKGAGDAEPANVYVYSNGTLLGAVKPVQKLDADGYISFDLTDATKKKQIPAIKVVDKFKFDMDRITENRFVKRQLQYVYIKAENPNNPAQNFCIVSDLAPAFSLLTTDKLGVPVDFPSDQQPTDIHE